MRAVVADVEGSITRDGVAVHYARHGSGAPTILLLPTWPPDSAAYSAAEFAAGALAVMDATGTDRAVLVGVSCGPLWSLTLCAERPDRVLGAVFIAPAVPFAPLPPERKVQRFDAVGWALETDPATLVATHRGLEDCTPAAMGRLAEKVQCPVLVIHGADDAVRSHAQGVVEGLGR